MHHDNTYSHHLAVENKSRVVRNVSFLELKVNFYSFQDLELVKLYYLPTSQQVIDQILSQNVLNLPNIDFFTFISRDIKDSMSGFCCTIYYKL